MQMGRVGIAQAGKNCLFGPAYSNSNFKQNPKENKNIQKNRSESLGADFSQKKRMLSMKQQNGKQTDAEGKIVFQGKSMTSSITASQDYAKALGNIRNKDKETALGLKKLRYNFKNISSQLLRSKTSTNARQVASKAKREVSRLKRLQGDKKYDSEEVQAAIAHAQAMERVAKKKARHLLEEEMVKETGGPCIGGVTEKEEESKSTEEKNFLDQLEEEEMLDESLAKSEDRSLEEQFSEINEALMDSLSELTESSVLDAFEEMTEDVMTEMMDEMWQNLNDMMEELGLDDLADSMFATADEDMDPADLKMMKIKHRCKEMKEIAEADRDYLKVIFDKLQRENAASGNGLAGSTNIQHMGMPAVQMNVPAGNMPHMSDQVANVATGFDVSI